MDGAAKLDNEFFSRIRLQLFLFDNGVTTLARNNWLRVHHWPQALTNKKHFSYTLASLYCTVLSYSITICWSLISIWFKLTVSSVCITGFYLGQMERRSVIISIIDIVFCMSNLAYICDWAYFFVCVLQRALFRVYGPLSE